MIIDDLLSKYKGVLAECKEIAKLVKYFLKLIGKISAISSPRLYKKKTIRFMIEYLFKQRRSGCGKLNQVDF